MSEYAVFAVSHSDKTMVVRRGFASLDAALDHPVIASQWKRVYVDHAPPAPQVVRPRRDYAPPRPWSISWVNTGHCYVVDAEGHKIMTVLGTAARRDRIAESILETFGV